MGCWNSRNNKPTPLISNKRPQSSIIAMQSRNNSLLTEWEEQMNAKKPRTPSLCSPKEDYKRRCETDNTNATSLKDSSITHDPIKDKTFNEAELRKRRQRTEKHVAIIAKENPELLDQQTKEIISRINPKNLKRK